MFSLKKARVTTAVMLFMDDILDEKDVLMIFDELEVQNDLCKSRSHQTTFP